MPDGIAIRPVARDAAGVRHAVRGPRYVSRKNGIRPQSLALVNRQHAQPVAVPSERGRSLGVLYSDAFSRATSAGAPSHFSPRYSSHRATAGTKSLATLFTIAIAESGESTPARMSAPAFILIPAAKANSIAPAITKAMTRQFLDTGLQFPRTIRLRCGRSRPWTCGLVEKPFGERSRLCRRFG
jgi:hypothetical protein